MGRARSFGLVLVIAGLLLLPAAQASANSSVVEERLVTFVGEVPLEGSSLGGARVLDTFPFAGVALVEGAPASLARLAALPGVAGVYEPEPLTLQLDRSREIVEADPASPAEAESWPRGGSVAIAVVDSGIDEAHPAFDARVLASVRVAKSGTITQGRGDDDGHGTHIAGILAGSGALSRDGRLHGVAPEAKLVGVDISDAFTTTTAVRAFEWIHEHRADYNIRVVSNSWGREKEDARYDPDDPVTRASDALVADGLVVVFSAGNRGRDGAATLTPEAMNPNVLAVGAASASGRPEAYSSRGPAVDASGAALDWVKPDLVAPGTGILSTRTSAHAPPDARSDEERYYTVMNGTSMAAPHVAAAAALLLDEDATLSPALVAALLTGTARDLGAHGADPDTGHGMLDVRAALQARRDMGVGERAVVVEREIPIHASGSATAVGGMIVLSQHDAKLPPAEAVAVPLAVPPSAARLELAFAWEGEGAFDVVLVDASGRERAFAPDGERAASLVVLSPERGAYRVVARAASPVAHAEYALDGMVVVQEVSMVESPVRFTARGYEGAAGFFETRSGAERFVDVPGDLHALMVMTGVLTVLGMGAMARRRA